MAEGILDLGVAIGRFAEKLEVAPALVVEKLALDLHTKISRRTPVDTGLARSRWTIREGAPDATPVPKRPRRKVDDTGAVVPPPGPSRDPPGGYTGTQPVYVTNNVPYVLYLEDGSSQQAPAGMIRISVMETRAEVSRILLDLEDK